MPVNLNQVQSLLQPNDVMTVLAVDDEALAITILKKQISDMGHHVITAENGQHALDILFNPENKIDAVMMDRTMPVMDGLTAVRRIKDHPRLRKMPIVMVTGADSAHEMKEGLDAGVFYYLTKPIEPTMLRSVLSAALRESKQSKILSSELQKHKTSFHLIETCRFKFQTLAEAESLAAFIANCFDEPERTLPGIGELLINAIEHGNLGVGYDGKTELIDNGTWRAEIDRLQQLSEHCRKFATATIAHKEGGTYLVIDDMGPGFEWKKYLQIDPSRAGDNHGRGIAQAKSASFDKLMYNNKGNQAIAFVKNGQTPEW